jgi:hypothetical protein
MFSNRAAPARPRPVESADKMVLVTMLEPAIAFSRTLISPLFLMLRGMWGASRWISSRDTCGQQLNRLLVKFS